MAPPRMAALRLDEIDHEAPTQVRAKIDDDYIDELWLAISDEITSATTLKDMPPIDVFFGLGRYCVADGWHRLYALEKAGIEVMQVRLHEGDDRAALIFACGANGTHGLRRSKADNELAVTTLLKDFEWSKASTRAIADHCRLSDHFVNKIRKAFEETDDPGARGAHLGTTRTGKDGKEYPARKLTSREGPSRKREAADGSSPPGPAAAPAGKKKSGSEKVSAEARKEAKRLFGIAVRAIKDAHKAFDSVGWLDVVSIEDTAVTVGVRMETVTDELTNVAEDLKGKWGR